MGTTHLVRAAAALSLAISSAASASSAPTDAPLSSRLARSISMHIEHATLRNTLTAFERASGLSLDPAWSEAGTEGLDPDRIIDLDAAAMPAQRLLERIARQADARTTWQVEDDGTIQLGPRSRLNLSRHTEVYPIRDLITEPPNFTGAATIDLQAALQRGSQSVLREGDVTDDRRDLDVRAHDLIDLITSTVETDQWADNGGTAATIRLYQGTLVIDAPGYIHRQLSGQLEPGARQASNPGK